jgi:hypothetical protein
MHVTKTGPALRHLGHGVGDGDGVLCVSMRELWLDMSSVARLGVIGGAA